MNCDAIARYYRWFEFAAFGPYLERSRFHWIEELCNAQRVLVLGDGDGRFLARFAARNTKAQIDVVELSSEMLSLARQRLEQERVPATQRIRLIQDDALTTPRLRGPYDLVVTQFFLDCLDASGQRKLVTRVGPLLAKESLWLVTDFKIIESSITAPIFRLFTQIMYLFFGLTTGLKNRTLVDFSPQLAAAGFQLRRSKHLLLDYLVSELWSRRSA